jgi:hypothetical protein
MPSIEEHDVRAKTPFAGKIKRYDEALARPRMAEVIK